MSSPQESIEKWSNELVLLAETYPSVVDDLFKDWEGHENTNALLAVIAQEFITTNTLLRDLLALLSRGR